MNGFITCSLSQLRKLILVLPASASDPQATNGSSIAPAETAAITVFVIALRFMVFSFSPWAPAPEPCVGVASAPRLLF